MSSKFSMNPSPLERYQSDLKRPGFRHDPMQEQAVHLLQKLYEDLIEAWEFGSKSGWFARWANLLHRGADKSPVTGLYFWGGVGRGKTYLMDSFFESLPFEQKIRVHFHRFMRRVHAELKTLSAQKNPLKIVADTISREARVICFDEFFVSDITDAMILGTLIEELFARGVTLVATSNIAPDELYKDGLQRARFLPAIALIKQHTQVVNIDGGIDYRLRALEQAELYHFPANEAAEQQLLACFQDLVPCADEIKSNSTIDIEGRPIMARYLAEDVAWFDFAALCDGPRSQNDYIELAREFHTVLLSDVPGLGASNEDQARRFINLVDEFYDRGVNLIISASRPLVELYSEGRLTFEFQRTVSRLLEMQSRDYLAKPHRP